MLGTVEEYREVNRDKLTKWSREYAEGLDAHIDTLDLLINDEAYEMLKEEGIANQWVDTEEFARRAEKALNSHETW